MKLFEASSASKLVLQALLVRGGAFRAQYEFWGEGLKDRIFIVANQNPSGDGTIILFSATTQIAKRRLHHGDRADLVLVPLDPATYDGVTHPCILDCEFPVKRKLADFVRHVEDRKYSPLTTAPDSIMDRIVAAVRASRRLSAAEKRLVIGDQSNDC